MSELRWLQVTQKPSNPLASPYCALNQFWSAPALGTPKFQSGGSPNGPMLSRAFAGSLSSRRYSRTNVSLYPVAVGVTAAAAALTVSALVNRVIAKNAERNNPPVGKFVEVGGVRLHYIERGQGDRWREHLVANGIIHGNRDP